MSNLILIAIIVAITCIIVALIRSKYKRTLLSVVCVVSLLFSVYVGFTMNSYYSTISLVRGTPEEHNPYEDFNFFEYDLNSFTWYVEEIENDEGEKEFVKYYYTTEYATSIEFDGDENKFVLLINDKPCMTNSTYGRLRGQQNLSFYNVDGELETKINVSLELTFYETNIKLKVETNADMDNIGYLNEYIKARGFHLRILNDPPYSVLDILSEKTN